ncbi:MAG: DUF2322 family protein [Gammaproteobacteria bacterium]|nr:DUF2322 family protein [Gammaproteobacteria bacterium]
MSHFPDILRTLPSVEHIARLELGDAQGQPVGIIENRPGSAGSVAVYNAVTRPDGWLDPGAAVHALTLYAEHTADARANPGKHPNIDRLLALIDNGQRLHVRSVSR